MKEVTVNSNNDSYRVYIDITLDKLPAVMEENKIKKSDRLFIITDTTVYGIYKDKLSRIKHLYNCKVFTTEPGEDHKTIDTVKSIYSFLIEEGADRNGILVAFGGGIIGDMVGFCAATYMRGIRFINIPTTLISQVDSSLGGKTGFNYNGLKNMIGAFYNPVFVFSSIMFLKTLPEEHIISGMGEILKYSLIKDKSLFNFLDIHYKEIYELENDKLAYIIRECVKIKSDVTGEDFKDTGVRNILNFGHTVGHAIETCSNYSISHGKSVALGMLTALKLSEKKLNLNENSYTMIKNVYKKLKLPTYYNVDNSSLFLYAIKHDKKNTGTMRFVLLNEIGKCTIKVEVTESELKDALNNSIFKEE